MSAKLMIVDGVSANTEYWIEHEVCRVGSGDSCQTRIAGMPEHAFTLEFREGKYLLFNRGCDAIYLRKHVLAPNDACEWKVDTDIQVGDYAILKLVVEGDPRPAITPSARGMFEQPLAADDPQVEPNKSSRVWQYVVIAGCIVASLCLFVSNRTTPRHADTMSEAYAEIDNHLHGLAEEDPMLRTIRARLQAARTLEVGGRDEEAAQQYLELKNWIMQQPASFREHPLAQQLEWYVLERLRAHS